jgi:hypothetical protein
LEQRRKGSEIFSIFWMPLHRQAEATRWVLHGFNHWGNVVTFNRVANRHEAVTQAIDHLVVAATHRGVLAKDFCGRCARNQLDLALCILAKTWLVIAMAKEIGNVLVQRSTKGNI